MSQFGLQQVPTHGYIDKSDGHVRISETCSISDIYTYLFKITFDLNNRKQLLMYRYRLFLTNFLFA